MANYPLLHDLGWLPMICKMMGVYPLKSRTGETEFTPTLGYLKKSK